MLPALRWFPQLIKVLAKEPHRCGSFGEDEGRGDKQRGGAEGQQPVMGPAVGRAGSLSSAVQVVGSSWDYFFNQEIFN